MPYQLSPRFRDHGKVMVEGKPLMVSSHVGSVEAADWNGDERKAPSSEASRAGLSILGAHFFFSLEFKVNGELHSARGIGTRHIAEVLTAFYRIDKGTVGVV